MFPSCLGRQFLVIGERQRTYFNLKNNFQKNTNQKFLARIKLTNPK